VAVRRLNAPGAARLASVRGDLVLEFPDGMTDLSFERPVGEAGAILEKDGLWVRILYCQHERTRVGARLEVRPPRASGQLEIRLVDRQGRAHVPEVGRDEGDGQAAGLQLEFTLPPGAEVAALRLEAPRAFREKRVPFELRDLPVR
jgi:hypothetical protein